MRDLIHPTDHLSALYPAAFGNRSGDIAPLRHEAALAGYLERQRVWREETTKPSNSTHSDRTAQTGIWGLFQALTRLRANV